MKTLVNNYLFDKSLKKITFSNLESIDLERILLITNVTDNTIIYSFADPLLGGSVVGNVLTLAYNTTSMSNTDSLQIFIDVSNSYNLEILSEVLLDGIDGIVHQLQSMKKSQGLPDSSGRVRVIAEGGTISTVSTVSTVSNMASIGGYAGNLFLTTQSNQGWASLRNKIGVS
jgi:hypothetical protein